MDAEIPGIGGTAVADAPAADAVVDAPAGGGEGGGSEETPSEEDAAAAAAAAAEGGGEGGEKTEPDLSDIETDGRKIDAKTRSEIAELKKTNPAAAKKWAESYFRNQAVMKEFPDAKTSGEAIARIREMRATIDSLGGQEGITELQSEVTDYRNEIAQFAKGDPALIKTLGEANPEGLATAAKNSLDWLRANKADIYKNTLLPAVSEILEAQNFDGALQNLIALTKEGKGQEVYDLLQKIVEWRTGHKNQIKNLTEAASKKDPREEEYANKEKALADKEQKIFQSAVETDVNRRNNPEIAKHLDPLVKELHLTPEGKSHFLNGLVSRIWNVLGKDQAYLKQVRAIRAKGDTIKTADFIHNAFVEILPEQFRRHRNEIYPSVGAKPKPAAGATPANGKPKVAPINLQQGQRPKADQVDWTKTTDAMYATGRAYLKDGKFVTGFKDAPPNKY